MIFSLELYNPNNFTNIDRNYIFSPKVVCISTSIVQRLC